MISVVIFLPWLIALAFDLKLLVDEIVKLREEVITVDTILYRSAISHAEIIIFYSPEC